MPATVELHLVQSHPTSLLNRDEHNQPKETWFGGTRRIRVSSQSLKRAARMHFASFGTVPAENLGVRTKRLPALLTDALTARGHTRDTARDLAVNTVWGMGVLDLDARRAAREQTNVMLFLAPDEIDRLAGLVHDRVHDLRAHVVPADTVLGATGNNNGADNGGGASEGPARSKRERKADCPPVFKDLGKACHQALRPHRAVDIALYGRMLAEERDVNVDGACDVAHAITVHQAVLDVDYFTAVDDLTVAAGDVGAGHLDTATLTAPVLYRYTALNTALLADNLHGDEDLTDLAVRAWADATVHAQPAAKHTSTAAWTRPSLIVAVVREDQPLSLANAFVRPVCPTYNTDMVEAAAAALAAHWQHLGDAYGHDGVRGVWHTWVGDDIKDATLPGDRLSAADLINRCVGFSAVIRP